MKPLIVCAGLLFAATTILAQQHAVHTSRIGALQTRAAATPEAPDGWGELGRACLAYADSGLLDAAKADAERRRGEQFTGMAAMQGSAA